MKNLEEINIWWEGPFSHKQIIDDKIDNKKYDNKPTNIGLYQVYGNHLLYGNNVLLYIGITTEQDFKTRLKNRWIIEDGSDVGNVEIYLGRIFSNDEAVNSKQEKNFIIKAEALLVNALKPAFNSSYINSVHNKKINNDDENFIVFNNNSYKNLLPELSTQRWWHDYGLNYEIVEQVASELECKITNNDECYGFDLSSNDNVFLGVDYAYWDRENIPLVIGVFKESIKGEILKKEFSSIGEDKDYYFMPACANLKNDGAIKEITENLSKIEKLLQNNN